jgi:hypothetical protein
MLFALTTWAYSAATLLAVLSGAALLLWFSRGADGAGMEAFFTSSPTSGPSPSSPPSGRRFVSRADTPLGRAMVGRTFRLHGVALDKAYRDSKKYELVDHAEFIAERQQKPLPETSGVMPGHLRRGDLYVDEQSGHVHIPLPEGTPVEVTDVRTVRNAAGWSHIWVVGRIKRLPRFPHVQRVYKSDVTRVDTHAYELTKEESHLSPGSTPLFEGVGPHEVALRDPGEVIISAKVAGVERADVDGQREPLERGFIPTQWLKGDV